MTGPVYRQAQPRAEPTRPAVSRWNDQAMEWLIAVLRVGSVIAAMALCFQMVWLAATLQLSGVCPALVEAVIAAVAGYLGWWHFGNEEWRKS